MPRIIPRSEWGSVTQDGKPFPTPSSPKMALPARELWVHHTVTKPTDDPLADARTVQRVAYGRGFNDISYSYLLHPSGAILEGRGLHVGAHTKERNSFALAFSFIGNYSELEPFGPQMEAGRWLRRYLIDIGALSPTHPLFGHRQNSASPSECPGNKLYPRIGELLLPTNVQEDDNMDIERFTLLPGQERFFVIEPDDGFFGKTDTLLTLETWPGERTKAWQFHSISGGGWQDITPNRSTRSLTNGVLHVHNGGDKKLHGSLLVKKV